MKIEFHSSGDGDELTCINVASALINHSTTRHNKFFDMDCTNNTFDVDDLEEIANHLLAFCKAERKRKEDKVR